MNEMWNDSGTYWILFHGFGVLIGITYIYIDIESTIGTEKRKKKEQGIFYLKMIYKIGLF